MGQKVRLLYIEEMCSAFDVSKTENIGIVGNTNR